MYGVQCANMKVTVRFGHVSVVVPCGHGDLSVRQLIIEAIVRYKKATAKPPDSWVLVHSLQGSGGGILDPDDRLSDVVDDREQIIACYEEEGGPSHHIGDGTSASSSPSSSASPTHSPAFQNHGLSSKHVSRRSPEIFQGMDHQFQPFSRNGIEITGEELQRRGNSGLTVVDAAMCNTLQVRRGSEPSLNRIGGPGDLGTGHSCDRVAANGVGSGPGPPALVAENKRWSAAPIIDDDDEARLLKVPEEDSHRDDGSSDGGTSGGMSSSKSPFSRGIGSGDMSRRSRDATRLSMQVGSFTGDLILSRWLDKDCLDGPRREPLGSSLSPDHSDSEREREEVTILIRPEGESLGLHVVPDYDPDTGVERGLRVQRLEPDSRAHRDGQLQVHDRIVEINGQHLINMPFANAHELFKEAMESPDILLRVVKASGRLVEGMKDKDSFVWSKGEPREEVKTPTSGLKKSILPNRTSNVLMSANTRKIGKILTIDLVKGPQGLGFSLTTRDNPAGGSAPIYVKNILPKGAAIEDGRLKPGDRLLEVSGTDMNGKSQSDAVNVLRNVPTGTKVILTVSRQEIKEEKDLSPKLPRELPSDKAEEEAAAKQREIMTLDIPVHDSERAGLGVSVKGKTSNNNDLGIFVKSVINGGAASKDGRLMPNDQLLNINGISLLDKSNSDAMETLRKAMCQEGPTPGILTLTIARRRQAIGGDDFRSSPSSQSSGNIGNSSLSGSAETLDDGCYGKNQQYTSDFGSSAPVTSSSRGNVPSLSLKKHRIEDRDLGFDVLPLRNPVIDRITGQNSLRNDSYCMANHEASWSSGGTTSSHLSYLVSGKRCEDDVVDHVRMVNGGVRPGGTIISQPNHESVMIEDEYVPPLPLRECNSSMVGSDSRRTSNNSDVAYASQTSLEDNPVGFSRDQFGRQSMSEKGHATLDAKNTDTYQRNKRIREERMRIQQLQAKSMIDICKLTKSEESDVRAGQLREAQSTDKLESRFLPMIRGKDAAPSTECLANIKALFKSYLSCPMGGSLAKRPSEANRNKKSSKDIGPGLGMKKSSSLESLQTMVQELSQAEDGDPALSYRPNPVRVVRGRGCNESFRAAVDRTYDAPLVEHVRPGEHPQMEAVTEEDGTSSGENAVSAENRRPGPQSTSTPTQNYQQHVEKPPPLNPRAAQPHYHGRGHRDQSAAVRPDSSLARGTQLQLSMPERSHNAPPNVVHVRSQSHSNPPPHKTPTDHHMQNGHDADTHSPTPPAISPIKAPKDKKKGSFFKGLGTMFRFGKHRDIKEEEAARLKEEKTRPASNTLGKPGSSLAQKQREERRAFAREEETRIRMERQRNEMLNQQNLQNGIPPPPMRTQSRQAAGNHVENPKRVDMNGDYLANCTPAGNYEDMSRPGCRSGFVDPSRYSHYENYSEIQQHLRQQQVYHSQRRAGGRGGDNSRERPKSNFYEYESVAALVRPATALGAPTTALQQQQQQQQQQLQKSAQSQNNGSQPSSVRSRRGPAIHNSLPKKSQNRPQHPSIESAFPQQKVSRQGPYQQNSGAQMNGHGNPSDFGHRVPPPYHVVHQQQHHLYQQHQQPLGPQHNKHPAQRAMVHAMAASQNMAHGPGALNSSSLHRLPNQRPGIPPPEFFEPKRRHAPAPPGHGSRVHPGFDNHPPPPQYVNGPPNANMMHFNGGSKNAHHHYPGVHPRQQVTQS